MKNKRIIALDLLKLLAIFFVVWGHFMQHILQIPVEENRVFLWITSFHMPLFMALAGLFAGNSFTRPWKHYLINRSRQLLLPWLSWSIIILLLIILFEGKQSIRGIGELFFNSLWFLKSLFVCGLLGLLGFKMKGNRILWVILSFLISQVILIWNVYTMYPCFLFGVICANKMRDIKAKAKSISIVTGILFFIFSLWAANSSEFWVRGLGIKQMLLSGELSLTQSTHFLLTLVIKRYGQILLGCLGTLFLLSLFIILFDRSSNHNISRIALLGQYTLGVYVIQTLIVETVLPYVWLVSDKYCMLFNVVIAPILSIAIIGICFYINILVSSWGYLPVILFGDKKKN
ncbi:MAG: acyltransferase family protein [Muribaculaceae bacterium]|nr:acyltransferase family protein [Muribaculaceae bacterium]